MCKRNGTLIAGLVLWILATAAFVTSMLTKYWKQRFVLIGSAGHYNLFDLCLSDALFPCSKFGWNPDDRDVHKVFIPRITLLIGAGFIAVGTLVGFFGMCRKAACPIITEGALVLSGGLVIIAGCGAFTGLNWNDGFDFYYSFYLGWVSGALYLLAGILIIIAGKNRAKNSFA